MNPKDRFDSEKIRGALVELFSDEELDFLCYDHFWGAYQKFSAGMTRTAKIHCLIEHCMQSGEVAALVPLLRRQKPGRIGEFEPFLHRAGTQVVTPDLKLAWCYVPAGEFLMGSEEGDGDAWPDEKPQHRVTLPAFYLGTYPITNGQYQIFVQMARHRKPRYWPDGQIRAGEEKHPVRGVSWSDAVAFCQWAAGVCGVPIRLLTEAEWEKGARGENGIRYPWGNEWREGYSNSEDRVEGTTVIGRYPKGVSPYGAYDMIGNVWEWTSTLHQLYPYQADDGRESVMPNKEHILRGGSWRNDAQTSRAAHRNKARNEDARNLGFRVGWLAPFSGHSPSL